MKKSERIKERVLFLLDALNSEDYESAGECLAENFQFKEFLIPYAGAQKYLERMATLQAKFKIKQIFANESSVCVFYDLRTSSNNVIHGCGLYEFQKEKVASLSLYSDQNPGESFSKDGN